MKRSSQIWRAAAALMLAAAGLGLIAPFRSVLAAISCSRNYSGDLDHTYGWLASGVECLRVTLPDDARFVRVEFSVTSGSFDVFGSTGTASSLDSQFNFGPIAAGASERFLDLNVGPGLYTLALMARTAGNIVVRMSTETQAVTVAPRAETCTGNVCSSSSPQVIAGQAVLAPGEHVVFPLAVACTGAISVSPAPRDPSVTARLYRPNNTLARSGGLVEFSTNATTRGTWRLYVHNPTGAFASVNLWIRYPGRSDCPPDLPVVVIPPREPAVGCRTGTAEITWPAQDSVVSGVVNVWGTVTCDSGFRYYKFELEDARCGPKGCFVAGPPAQCNDTSIICPANLPFVRPVTNGRLLAWDTTKIPNGTWVLRMSAVGASGWVLPQQTRLRVTIRN